MEGPPDAKRVLESKPWWLMTRLRSQDDPPIPVYLDEGVGKRESQGWFQTTWILRDPRRSGLVESFITRPGADNIGDNFCSIFSHTLGVSFKSTSQIVNPWYLKAIFCLFLQDQKSGHWRFVVVMGDNDNGKAMAGEYKGSVGVTLTPGRPGI